MGSGHTQDPRGAEASHAWHCQISSTAPAGVSTVPVSLLDYREGLSPPEHGLGVSLPHLEQSREPGRKASGPHCTVPILCQGFLLDRAGIKNRCRRCAVVIVWRNMAAGSSERPTNRGIAFLLAPVNGLL